MISKTDEIETVVKSPEELLIMFDFEFKLMMHPLKDLTGVQVTKTKNQPVIFDLCFSDGYSKFSHIQRITESECNAYREKTKTCKVS